MATREDTCSNLVEHNRLLLLPQECLVRWSRLLAWPDFPSSHADDGSDQKSDFGHDGRLHSASMPKRLSRMFTPDADLVTSRGRNGSSAGEDNLEGESAAGLCHQSITTPRTCSLRSGSSPVHRSPGGRSSRVGHVTIAFRRCSLALDRQKSLGPHEVGIRGCCQGPDNHGALPTFHFTRCFSPFGGVLHRCVNRDLSEDPMQVYSSVAAGTPATIRASGRSIPVWWTSASWTGQPITRAS